MIFEHKIIGETINTQHVSKQRSVTHGNIKKKDLDIGNHWIYLFVPETKQKYSNQLLKFLINQ